MNILIDILINPISLKIYDSSGKLSLIIPVGSIYAILVLITIILLIKKQYIFFFATFFFLLFITITVSFLYSRGSDLNDIRNNGFILLKNIEKFKSINNRYPYDIDEIYSFMSSRGDSDLQKVKKSNNMFSINFDDLYSDKGDCFSLTVDDRKLSYGFFIYRRNPARFELGESD